MSLRSIKKRMQAEAAAKQQVVDHLEGLVAGLEKVYSGRVNEKLFMLLWDPLRKQLHEYRSGMLELWPTSYEALKRYARPKPTGFLAWFPTSPPWLPALPDKLNDFLLEAKIERFDDEGFVQALVAQEVLDA